jgi:phosphatidylglycerol:prolipoprotein diacylglycerol transferase
MFPTLLRFGHAAVFSYGVANAIAFLLAIVWLVQLAKREGLSVPKMEGLGLIIVISAAIGSRLLTALDYPGFYSGGWRQFLFEQMLGKGGVFYGGFLMAVVASAIYFRFAHLPGWQVADCAAPGLALAQGIGRIGCFLAGCCWGRPTDSLLGVTFTSEVAHRLTGVPLNVSIHPTQLYEAGLVLGVIPLLLWLRKSKTFQGEVILAYVMYYATARFFVEFLRDDPRGTYVMGLLSTSQLISVLLLPAAVGLFLVLRGQGAVIPPPFKRGLAKVGGRSQKVA